MTAETANSAMDELAEKLGPVRVGLRDDLHVTRHLFRGKVSYIIGDPITFQSQRLDPSDYELLAEISPQRTLGETFDSLTQQGRVTEEDRTPFFRFVLGLHRLGFLHLPVADSKILYKRFKQRETAMKRQRWKSILFFRIPVWNPSNFLDRTHKLAAPFFSRWFFLIWLATVCAALYVCIENRAALAAPMHGLLATKNLFLMWLTLIGLKVFHEFGHAYACRHYGGHVPEMGIYLIMFTPCAYVDATASWGFTRRRERLVVGLAGMYIESLIAAIAVFVWALTDAGLLNSLAFNVIFLASIVTALFNINPLMRYDGYYILSDCIEIPNLRSRAQSHVNAIAKKLFLGLDTTDRSASRRLRVILATYGIAAAIYRITLVLTISMVLAMKALFIGIALAAMYMGGSIGGLALRATRYLWHAEETVPVRRRAVLVGSLLLFMAPAGLALIPVPSHVHASGIILSAEETVVRAETDGFVEISNVRPGTSVPRGMLLAKLENSTQKENVAKARANLRSAEIRHAAFVVNEPIKALQERAFIQAHQQSVREYESRVAALRITAPASGLVVSGLDSRETGSFLRAGAPIATIVNGDWRVRTVLTEEQLLSVRPQVGDTVRFRPRDTHHRTIDGTVSRVSPGGTRLVDMEALTQVGGGDIAVDPESMEASEPFFEVVIDLGQDVLSPLSHNLTGVAQFDGRAEPIATRLVRRIVRFLNKLSEE